MHVEYLSSVDSNGLCDKTSEPLVSINKQSHDIPDHLMATKDGMDVGAGDQAIRSGYASEETADKIHSPIPCHTLGQGVD
jgi:S-adenosylmethionine synthetase